MSRQAQGQQTHQRGSGSPSVSENVSGLRPTQPKQRLSPLPYHHSHPPGRSCGRACFGNRQTNTVMPTGSCAAGPAPHHTRAHGPARGPDVGTDCAQFPGWKSNEFSLLTPPHKACQTLSELVRALVLAKPEEKCFMMGKTRHQPRARPGLRWLSRAWPG